MSKEYSGLSACLSTTWYLFHPSCQNEIVCPLLFVVLLENVVFLIVPVAGKHFLSRGVSNTDAVLRSEKICNRVPWLRVIGWDHTVDA